MHSSLLAIVSEGKDHAGANRADCSAPAAAADAADAAATVGDNGENISLPLCVPPLPFMVVTLLSPPVVDVL